MNPTPASIDSIRAYVDGLAGGWGGNTLAQILAAANAGDAVDNPTQRPTVAAAYTYADLLGGLSDESAAKLVALPSLPAIVETINAGEMLACQRWILLLVKGQVITPQEAAAIGAVMSATEPDPSWQPQVSWAEANLGRKLDSYDILAARPE